MLAFLFVFNSDPKTVEILVGTNNLQSGGKRYKPQKFIRHERHDQPAFANDIGLIHMQDPIQFNANVQPIKYSTKFVDAGERLQTTGWGRLSVSSL